MGLEDCHALLRRARNDGAGKVNLFWDCSVHDKAGGHCEERSDEAISPPESGYG